MNILQYALYRTKQKGFTIVELLIVVVVIGILAAIVIVAYNGITTSANRVMVASEAKQWVKLFELYRAQNGSLPSLANGNYCLGTGFPSGYCAEGDSTNGYAESTGAPIITALSEVGSPPLNSNKWVMQGGNRVGPWVQVTSSDFRITTFITANSTDACSDIGMTDSVWISGNGHDVICRIHIPKT
jgi:prepilin-type N-terminal cleavage/methylation domain-containing protein|tara:strand:- start:2097 stop:2654 length:558 start_codon:yes stop_codon:yes gene_type:complete